MKIPVEMIFKTDNGKIKCFDNVFKNRNDSLAAIAYKAVLGKRRELIGKADIIEVKAAREDVTEQVLEIDKVYHRDRIAQFDSELPF